MTRILARTSSTLRLGIVLSVIAIAISTYAFAADSSSPTSGMTSQGFSSGPQLLPDTANWAYICERGARLGDGMCSMNKNNTSSEWGNVYGAVSTADSVKKNKVVKNNEEGSYTIYFHDTIVNKSQETHYFTLHTMPFVPQGVSVTAFSVTPLNANAGQKQGIVFPVGSYGWNWPAAHSTRSVPEYFLGDDDDIYRFCPGASTCTLGAPIDRNQINFATDGIMGYGSGQHTTGDLVYKPGESIELEYALTVHIESGVDINVLSCAGFNDQTIKNPQDTPAGVNPVSYYGKGIAFDTFWESVPAAKRNGRMLDQSGSAWSTQCAAPSIFVPALNTRTPEPTHDTTPVTEPTHASVPTHPVEDAPTETVPTQALIPGSVGNTPLAQASLDLGKESYIPEQVSQPSVETPQETPAAGEPIVHSQSLQSEALRKLYNESSEIKPADDTGANHGSQVRARDEHSSYGDTDKNPNISAHVDSTEITALQPHGSSSHHINTKMLLAGAVLFIAGAGCVAHGVRKNRRGPVKVQRQHIHFTSREQYESSMTSALNHGDITVIDIYSHAKDEVILPTASSIKKAGRQSIGVDILRKIRTMFVLSSSREHEKEHVYARK